MQSTSLGIADSAEQLRRVLHVADVALAHLSPEDLLDELCVTIAPCLLGGREAPTLLEGEGFPMGSRRALRLVDVSRHGDEIYCRFAVAR